MKVKMLIPTPDDRRETINSSFLYKTGRNPRYTMSSYMLNRRSMNHRGEIEISIPRPEINNRINKLGHDPILERMKSKVTEMFLSPRRGYADEDDDWMSWFGWRYDGQDVRLSLMKVNGSFMLNSHKKNKEDCASAIAKIILYGTTNRSAERLRDYIDRNVMYSQNIIYALENRTPYWFFKDGSKVECRINMQLIDEDEVAIEISDGVWGSMKMKDANIFINCYRSNTTRSKKWSNLSPKKLFNAVMGRLPSDSELKLMIAWLMQNRTSKMVEDRATVLLKEMTDKYDDMVLLNAECTKQWLGLNLSDDYEHAVLVRGKLGDWIIYANNQNSKFQRVSAVHAYDQKGFQGPFCIDNLHDNSSIGDQIASRAMILKNDEQAKSMIYTLRSVEKHDFRFSDDILDQIAVNGQFLELSKFIMQYIKED